MRMWSDGDVMMKIFTRMAQKKREQADERKGTMRESVGTEKEETEYTHSGKTWQESNMRA